MFHQLFTLATLALLSHSAWSAENCAVEIHGTDQMTYDKSTIVIPKACKTFKVTLVHSGTMPKNVMGHNWVLALATDLKGIVDDGQEAGEEHDYLKANDSRVVAHTRLLSGGEQDSITFDTARLKSGENYEYFCSYPIHAMLMKGKLTLSE